MRMESDDTIRISIVVANGYLKLEMKSPGQALLPLPLKITPLKLAELRRTLGIGLLDFVAILVGGTVDKPAWVAKSAISQLYSVGAELGFAVFGNLLEDVGAYLRAAAPGWAKAGRNGYAPPPVKLEGSLEFPLPLEFMPLFDTSEIDFPVSGDIIGPAARFPVFSTLFCRSPVSATRAFQAAGAGLAAARDVVENHRPMLVRLFIHDGLQAASAERDFFRNAQGVGVRGPWPDVNVEPATFVDEFSDRVLEASKPGDLLHPNRDDVQHFICHCDTEKAASRDFELLLAHRRKRLGFWPTLDTHSATLKDLQSRAAARSVKGRSGPLVFLNACGSSSITPDGVTSFPDLFLETGSCAVIGTEVAVPDLAAAEFSKAFYTAFMSGKSLGEAMYEARAELLRRSNPVGAIYSAYALPELRLRNPVAAE